MTGNPLDFYMNILIFVVLLYFILMIIIAVSGIKINNRLKELVEQNERRLKSDE